MPACHKISTQFLSLTLASPLFLNSDFPLLPLFVVSSHLKFTRPPLHAHRPLPPSVSSSAPICHPSYSIIISYRSISYSTYRRFTPKSPRRHQKLLNLLPSLFGIFHLFHFYPCCFSLLPFSSINLTASLPSTPAAVISGIACAIPSFALFNLLYFRLFVLSLFLLPLID